MKLLCTSVALALLSTAPAFAQPAPAVPYVERAIPADRAEVVPAAPGPGFAWVRGHWVWRAYRGWVWAPGHYVRGVVPAMPAVVAETPPPVPGPGWYWVRGHYVWAGGAWRWHRGHWVR